MTKSLKQAVRDNRRFHKYQNMLQRIRLRTFDYEDAGKIDKVRRIIGRIEAICGPRWQAKRRGETKHQAPLG